MGWAWTQLYWARECFVSLFARVWKLISRCFAALCVWHFLFMVILLVWQSRVCRRIESIIFYYVFRQMLDI